MQHTIRRALVSVFDKTGVVELCKGLAALDVQIVSSGGTARMLQDHDVPVVEVSDYTGFPEMLDGRVKTLHPKIHGGILGRRGDESHVAQMREHDIHPIDLVVVNLYPFRQTVADPGATPARIVEMIDIGGPTMVRAAAKNFADVGVVVDPSDYGRVLDEVGKDGGLSDVTRRELAHKAFGHTAGYDAAVSSWFAATAPAADDASPFPDRFEVDYTKIRDMRYGENPHQAAAFYADPSEVRPSVSTAEKLQGKALSFNNILDFDAALCLAAAFPDGACAIIKHGNPCGVATHEAPGDAFRNALSCDPVSAFGGVIAFNRVVDETAALAIKEAFYEGVIAPGFTDEARAALRKKKNLRLLAVGNLDGLEREGYDLRRVAGGILLQDWDDRLEAVRDARVVTKRPPTEDEWRALEFSWLVARHVKSNAIVYALPDRTVGIGAGQMSRVDSARLGVEKAQSPLEGCVMASDAFFPFRDGIDAAAAAGIRAVVQPGGSIRDEEVVQAADEHDMTMVFTGHRHFRH